MGNNTQHTPNSFRGDKDNNFAAQAKIMFQYLQDHTATASMVTDATKVVQKNITRYKRNFEKNGLLWQVKRDYCKITGHKAWYLTTDPAKAPNTDNRQLRLPL